MTSLGPSPRSGPSSFALACSALLLSFGACARPGAAPAGQPASASPTEPGGSPRADDRATNAPTLSTLARPARDVEEEGWSPIQDDFPYQASAVTASYPSGNTTNKSISVRLGKHAACNFDTDLLRLSTAWTGKFLTATGVTFDTSHGGHPQVPGTVQFGTAPGPGWADARGTFTDPRPIPFGPLPERWGRWDGLYTVGDDVVFGYTVHGTKVHEWNSAVQKSGRIAFVRTLSLAPVKKPLLTRLFDLQGPVSAKGEGLERRFTDARGTTQVAIVGAPTGAALAVLEDGKVVLSLPKTRSPSLLKIVTHHAGTKEPAVDMTAMAEGAPRLPRFEGGGPAHWPTPIVTRGVLGSSEGAYVVDRITTPYPGVYKGEPEDWKDNVFRRRIMLAGLDFFSDGTRAAVSTWEGDVWVVSGIDDDLDKLQWRRFASGLFEPLGLKIVNDVVYVTGRDQLTRLHDLNGDGEADHYENFNNQITNSPGFHEFQFDLHTDRAGNFYTAKAGPVRGGGRGFGGGGGNGEVTPMAGTIHKISKDGKTRTVFATGFRAPNGIGVGPQGQITTGDNEGTWMPSSPINWVRKGGFYGVEDLAHRKPIPEPDKPLAWLSKTYDNSGGAQVWVTSRKFGPLEGELLHLSYGRAAIYWVLKEKVGQQMQGGVVRLLGGADAAQFTGEPVKLTSSAMRARFNDRDGQLYVVGLSGWQSDAVSLTGFDRVRYTGKEVQTVSALKVTSAGVHLTFSHPLDPASVAPENFSGERWNYRRTKDYGSPEFSVENPTRRGHDRLDIFEATLSKDARTVSLAIDDLRPTHQMLLKFKVKTAEGLPIAQTVMHTIHVVPRDPNARANNLVASRGRPGLKLSLTAPGAKAAEVTVVPGVQLYVARDRASGALTPAGAFQASWEGTLRPELPGDHVLATDAAGEVDVFLDGKPVLSATAPGLTRSKPLTLPGRPTPLRVVYRGKGTQDDHVRLLWAAANPEKPGQEPLAPLPANAFRHQPTPDIQASSQLRQAREMFFDHRCASCHVSQTPVGAPPELAMDAPSLDGIGSRLNWHWMQRWIANPRGMRSSARMPQMFKGKNAEADLEAVAAYLASLRDEKQDEEREKLAAAVRRKVEEQATSAQNWDDRLFAQLLCNGCHVDVAQGADDGRLRLSHVAHKYPQGAVAAYLRNPAAHYPWNPMPDFRLSEAEAVDLEILLTRGAWAPPLPELPRDPQVLARGKRLVVQTGCLACHGLGGLRNEARTLDLASAAKGEGGNCIEGTGPADYGFHETERNVLQGFVKAGALTSIFNHAPAEQFEREARNLRCTGCHGNFDGFPALDGLGEKLQPEWVAAFVAGRLPYKPRAERHPDGHEWLKARMPAFKARAGYLAEGMAAAAGYGPSSKDTTPVVGELARTGKQLVYADGGFSCIGCHAVGSEPATQVFEAEGINLAYSAERLRPAYFQRWIRNPLKIDPQTKMPTYFDESGASPLDGILGGDADRQIEAMWNFVRSLGGGRTPTVAPP